MRDISSNRFFVLLLASLGFAAACGDEAPPPVDPGPTVDAGATSDAPDVLTPMPSCFNHIKDGTETDVDCGGDCAERCVLGKTCRSTGDCAGSAYCGELPANIRDPEIRVCDRRVTDCSECGTDVCLWVDVQTDDASEHVLYCEKLAKDGAACRTQDRDLGSTCEPGFACGSAPGDSLREICLHTLPAGAACDSEICGEGLGCVNHACRALVATGAPCLNDNECALGLACNPFEKVCRPRGHAGDACYRGEDAYDQCAPGLKCTFSDGLVCTSSGACGNQMDCCAIPGGAECRPFDGRTHCQPPSGTCRQP